MNQPPGRPPSEKTPLIIGAVGVVVFLLFTWLAVRSSLGSNVGALSSQLNFRMEAARTTAKEMRSLGEDWESAASAGRLSSLSGLMTEKIGLLRTEQGAASQLLVSLREKARRRSYRDYLKLVEDAFAKQERGLNLAAGVMGEAAAAVSAAAALEKASKSYEIALRADNRVLALLQLQAALKALDEAKAADGGRVLEAWPGLSELLERHRKVVAAALTTRGTRRELEPALNGLDRFEAQSDLLRLTPRWEDRWQELAPRLDNARLELASARAAAERAERYYEERWGTP